MRVTCSCGFENWVDEEKNGQTIACFVCGEDLVAIDDELKPAAELEASTEEPSPPPTPRQTSSSKPRSPFEDENEEPETVRPQFKPAPPSAKRAAPPPGPRPRSPFEVGAEEPPKRATPAPPRPSGKLVADPFSLEMVPAPDEGPSTTDQMEDTRPKQSRQRSVFIDTISPHDAPTGEKCTQCGRPLRGSWDRVESAAGVLCYVCSNQGIHGMPDRLNSDVSPRREIPETELLTRPRVHIQPTDGRVWFLDPKSPEFKRVVLFLACSVLLIAFIVATTGVGTVDRAASTVTETAQTASAATEEVPDWVKYPLWAWRAIASVAGLFFAIYLTLDRDSHLPHDTFMRNALQIGAVMALLSGLGLVAGATSMILSEMFVPGIIWNLFASVIYVLVAFGILTNLLDFRIRDFFWLILFYFPVSQVFVYVIGLFIGWGLHALVT